MLAFFFVLVLSFVSFFVLINQFLILFVNSAILPFSNKEIQEYLHRVCKSHTREAKKIAR